VTARDVIAQALARTEQIGRWPTTAELAQLRRDNAAFAKALGDVLALAELWDHTAAGDHIRTTITAALSEVTP